MFARISSAYIILALLVSSCSRNPDSIPTPSYQIAIDEVLTGASLWDTWVREPGSEKIDGQDIGIYRRTEPIDVTLKWSDDDQEPILHTEIGASVVSTWLTKDGRVPKTFRVANYRYIAITTKHDQNLDEVTSVFLALHARANGIDRVGDGKEMINRRLSVAQMRKDIEHAYSGSGFGYDQSYSFPVNLSEGLCVAPGIAGRRKRKVPLSIFVLPCEIKSAVAIE